MSLDHDLPDGFTLDRPVPTTGTSGQGLSALPAGFSLDQRPVVGAPAAAKPAGYNLTDLPKEVVAGALHGVGSAVSGIGDVGRMIARPIVAGVNAAAGSDVLPQPTNAFAPIGGGIAGLGEKLAGTESDAAKAAKERPIVTGDITDPGSLALGEGARSPMSLALGAANLAGEAVPMLAGGLEARGLKLAPEIAKALPAITEKLAGGGALTAEEAAIAKTANAAVKSSARRTLAAGAGIGGLQGAEGSAEAERARIIALPEADIAKLPGFQQRIAQGMSPQDARSDLAETSANSTFATTLPVATAAGAVGVAPLLHDAQGVLSRIAGKSVARRAAVGAGIEAPVQAGVAVGQNAAGIAGANAATGENRSLTENSAPIAGVGAAMGAGFGAFGGIATRPNVPHTEAPPGSLHEDGTPPGADFVADSAGNTTDVRAAAPAPPVATGGERMEAATPAPNVPWINADTGEIRTPTDVEVKDQFHRMFEQASAEGLGMGVTAASRDLAQQWGLPPTMLRKLRSQALAERKEGITPDNRPQVAATDAAAQTTADNEALAALDQNIAAAKPVETAPSAEHPAADEPTPAEAGSPQATQPEPVPGKPAESAPPNEGGQADAGVAQEPAQQPAAAAIRAEPAAGGRAHSVPAEDSQVVAAGVPAESVGGHTATAGTDARADAGVDVQHAGIARTELAGSAGNKAIESTSAAPAEGNGLRAAKAPASGRDALEAVTETPPPGGVSASEPAKVETAALESAAHPGNDLPEPTPAQHEANNFKQGHVDLHGLDVTIQVPKGGMRRGVDAQGKPWERPASDHYGHIRGTQAADGEPHDVYLGPHAEDPNAKVFVIRQVKPDTDVHDEDKAMIGYASGKAARASYQANFPKGLKTFGGITQMTLDEFKQAIGKPPENANAPRPVRVEPVRSMGEVAPANDHAAGQTGAEGVAPLGRQVKGTRRTKKQLAQAAHEMLNERAAQVEPKPEPAAAITDVGEKIGGARKDMWKSRNMVTGDLSALNPRELVQFVKKEAVWKRPDYQALAEKVNASIGDQVTAAKDRLTAGSQARHADVGAGIALAVKHVYDAIPQPADTMTREGFADYVQAVERVRDALADVKTSADLKGLLPKVFGADIETGTGYHRRFNTEAAGFAAAKLLGNKFVRALQISDHDFSKAMGKAMRTGFPAKREAWQRQYAVVDTGALRAVERDRYVNGKAEAGFTPVSNDGRMFSQFHAETADAALAKAREAGAALVVSAKGGHAVLHAADSLDAAAAFARGQFGAGATERVKPASVEKLKHVVRTGNDFRRGKDVAADDFQKAFGFRAVEFGNWTDQGDRQASLNHAFDALHDLADALKIPPQAISLDGQLGMAFGARGGGKAAAHYETARAVINLTKTSGAGSAAHEWAHALDDYFGKLSGDPKLKGREWAVSDALVKRYGIQTDVGSLRPELVKAISNVMRAINERARTPDEAAKLANEAITRQTQRIDSAAKRLARALGEKADSEFQTLLESARTAAGEGHDELAALMRHVEKLDRRVARDEAGTALRSGLAARNLAARALRQALDEPGADLGKTTTDYRALSAALGPYWARPHELFARAFESFIHDKITGQGQRSDYLVHPAKRDRGKTEATYPYPGGSERVSMNEAFQRFVDTLQTRKTEKGTALFAFDAGTNTDPAAVAHTLAITKAAREEQKSWGPNAPRLRVVADPEGLPASAKADPNYRKALGFYDGRTETAYIVASNNRTVGRAVLVIAHEVVGHHGMEAILNQHVKGGWDKMVRDIAALRASGKGSEAMRKVLADVDRLYAGSSDAQKARETLAIMAERGVRNGLLDRAVAAVRAFVRTMFPNLKMNEQDLRRMVSKSREFVNSPTAAPGYGPEAEAAARANFAAKADPFYSALGQSVAVAKGMPRRADARAWKQWFDGAQRRGEFKQGEREWMGVDQFLDSHKGQITREAVQNFVRDNQVRLSEKTLGGLTGEANLSRQREIIGSLRKQGVDVEEAGAGTFELHLVDDANKVMDRADLSPATEQLYSEWLGLQDQTGGGAKFADYQMPGGDNYREMLLTLPKKEWIQSPAVIAARSAFEGEYPPEAHARLRIKGDSGFRLAEQKLLATIRAAEQATNFLGSHFDEPNILAHVRMDDRTGPNGEKILHVEEVQSDWHQQGRKQGYAGAEEAKVNAALKEYETLMQRMAAQGLGNMSAVDRARIDELRPIVRGQGNTSKAVPDAPFKKEWSLLAMKRVLREAAEKGYDKVTWTTGEQQAARYDLSKHVDAIGWLHHDDGTYSIDVEKDGKTLQKFSDLSESELASTIGKEPAEKIVEGAKSDTSGELSGLDLKIGGAGMRAFYDKMLPNEVNKYVKQWGAKVAGVEIGIGERDPNPLKARDATDAGEGAIEAEFPTKAEAEAYGDEHGGVNIVHEPGGTALVHSVDITPAMRESVMHGQPQFAIAPATSTAAFQRYFAGSKVVDAAGEPMVVYHGTADEFSVFKDVHAGANTGHMTAPLGHFFDESADQAQRYAEKASGGVPADERVISAYLSIKNPKPMTLDEFMALDSQDESRALKATLQAQGYDGIKLRVDGRNQWIAFRSEQVKSTENRGTFDGANPDINFSMGDQRSFADEVHARLAGGGQRGAMLRMGRTPAVLRMLSFPDLPLRMPAGVLFKIATGKGGNRPALTERQIARLPELLDDPVAIFRSNTKPNGVMVMTTAKDALGNNVLVSVDPHGVDGNAAVNVMTSAYGKNRKEWVKAQVEAGRLLFADKEKGRDILEVSGSTLNRGAEPGSRSPQVQTIRSAEDLRNFRAAQRDAALDAASSTKEGSFSLPGASVDAMDEGVQEGDEGALAGAKAWLRGKGEDFVPSMLGWLQRRHLTELMAGHQALHAAKAYDEEVQQLDADRSQLMAGAIDAAEHPTSMLKKGGAPIAQQLRDYVYETGLAGWLGRKRPQGKALADVMHAATIEAVDPSEEFQPLKMKNSLGEWEAWSPQKVKARIKELRGQMRGRPGDDKIVMMGEVKRLKNLAAREKSRMAAYPALVAKYQALPAEGKALYRQMRDWHAEMRDETEKALIARIEALGRDMMATSGKDMAMRYTRQLTSQIRAQFEANRVEGVYFPLNRDGDYWVSYEDGTGAQGFRMLETAKNAAAEVARIRARGGRVLAQGRRDRNFRAKNAPSGTFVAEIINVLKKAGAPEKVQDEVYQTFLRSLPEMSMRKHSIHRQATPGFSDDITRSFSKNAFHGAHQLARLRHAHVMQSIVDAMQASMDNYRQGEQSNALDVARGDALLGELKKRHDFIMSPTDTQLANMLNGLGFLWYLGASPASALVNLTQNAQVTLPVLAARHGWPKTAKVLGAAMRDSLRTFGNIDRTLTSPEERRAFNVLAARGDISKTQSHTLAGLAEGQLLQSNPAYAKVMSGLSWMFHQAEVINREAAGMAAFRLAREKSDFNTAVQYASDIINGTHFDYAAANRPRHMQGNTMRVALQFKNYSIGMTWVLYRNLIQTFNGATPEVRRQARRSLTGVLGMTSLMAGTMGLPIMGAVKLAAQASYGLFGPDDEPWDFDTEFRQFLADMLGPEAAKWVADGAVNRTGLTVSSRVSLSNLWVRDNDRDLQGQDAYYNALDGVVGPIGGMVKNLYIGQQRIADGHVWRGIETMLPKFAKDAMKALRFEHEGASTLRGDPIVDDVATPEAFVQLLGFQPTRLFEQSKVTNALMGYQHAIQDRRQMLMNAYAMAVRSGDDRDVAMAKIHAFNAKYPEIAIKNESLRQSMRARARYSANAEGGVAINKKLAPRLREMTGLE